MQYRIAKILFVIFFTIVGINESSAQSRSSLLPRAKDSLEDPSLTGIPLAGEDPAEAPVDPAKYLVGPTDIFQIVIGGPRPQFLSPIIGADGLLPLPQVEAFDTDGLTLAEVLEKATALLENEFRNVPVSISLLDPRSVLVHISGAVTKPGRYKSPAYGRLDNLLKFAKPGKPTRGASLHWRYQAGLRSIKITHVDGAEEVFDIYKYYISGDLGQNPYLQAGDVVHVPTYLTKEDAFRLEGQISWPGTYDCREDDTLQGILAEFAGETGIPQTASIRLTRYNADGTFYNKVIQLDTLSQPFPIQPRDHIHVGQYDRGLGMIYLSGAFNYPGQYPVDGERLSLKKIIEMAGGLRDNALKNAAFVERNRPTELRPDDLGKNRNRLAEILPLSVASDPSVRRYIQGADMDYVSREYLARELVMQNRVSLNLETALNDPDFFLYPGDHLYIPEDEGTVLVIGLIARPGLIAWTPETTVGELIEHAGGVGSDAAQVYRWDYVIDRWVEAENSDTIRSGEIVFVNREDAAETLSQRQLEVQEVQIAEGRKDALIRRIQTIVTTISTTITLYLLLRNQK